LRKLLLVLVVAAMVAVMTASVVPALAQTNGTDESKLVDKSEEEKKKEKDKEKKDKAKEKEKEKKEEEAPSTSGGIFAGNAALFALGGGALIIGGGLLVRGLLRRRAATQGRAPDEDREEGERSTGDEGED